MFNLFSLLSQARVQFQNEYEILCHLPSHENIIHMYAFFFDRANPDVSKEFRRVGRNIRTMSLFLLMDEHPMSMQEQLDILTEGQGPKVLYEVHTLCIYICVNMYIIIMYYLAHVQWNLSNPGTIGAD